MSRFPTSKKWIYSGLLTGLILITLLIALLASNAGSRLIILQCQKMFPGTFQVKQIEGNLLSTITLNDIDYRAPSGAYFHAGKIALSWRPERLLHRQFVVENISLQNAEINLMTAGSTSSPTRINHPPSLSSINAFLNQLSWLAIKRIDFKSIHLTIDHQTNTINTLRFEKANADDHHLLTVDSSMGSLTGAIKLSLRPYPAWEITLQGKPSLHTTSSRHLSFSLTSTGALTDHAEDRFFYLSLKQLSGKLFDQPLQGQADIRYRQQQLRVVPSVLRLGKAELSAQGTLQEDWNLTWKLTIPKLDTFISGCKGQLAVSGKIVGAKKNPVVDMSLNTHQLHYAALHINNLNATLHATPLKNKNTDILVNADKLTYNHVKLSTLRAKINTLFVNQSLQTTLNTTVNQVNSLHATVILPDFHSWNDQQQINGTGKVSFVELDKLFSKLPDNASLTGRLTGDFSLHGLLDNPAFLANFLLDQAVVNLPKLGLSIKDIHLLAHYDLDKKLSLQGQFRSGNGKAEVEGVANIATSDLSARLNLTGQQLMAFNSHEYRINLSPTITVNYTPNEWSLSGKVQITSAEITPTDFSSVVSLPTEISYTDEETTEDDLFDKLTLNLQIQTEKPIYLAYRKFNTELTGQLTIQKQAGSPPTALGELEAIRGRYRAYGNSLKIDYGKLIYTGNLLSNPGLNVRATKQIRTVSYRSGQSQFNPNGNLQGTYTGSSNTLVGIDLQGTLDQPKLTFFSDPAGLSQKDIISYIVFGHPQSQVSGLGSLALINEIATESNNGTHDFGDLPHQLQDSLGLSELEIGSSEFFDPVTQKTSTATTVSVGKDLGNDLSIHYSTGIFQSLNVLNIRYQINRHLHLQAETSALESGADLMYEIERD